MSGSRARDIFVAVALGSAAWIAYDGFAEQPPLSGGGAAALQSGYAREQNAIDLELARLRLELHLDGVSPEEYAGRRAEWDAANADRLRAQAELASGLDAVAPQPSPPFQPAVRTARPVRESADEARLRQLRSEERDAYAALFANAETKEELLEAQRRFDALRDRHDMAARDREMRELRERIGAQKQRHPVLAQVADRPGASAEELAIAQLRREMEQRLFELREATKDGDPLETQRLLDLEREWFAGREAAAKALQGAVRTQRLQQEIRRLQQAAAN